MHKRLLTISLCDRIVILFIYSRFAVHKCLSCLIIQNFMKKNLNNNNIYINDDIKNER